MIDLAALRREYSMNGLDRDELDNNPFIQFERWFQQAMDAGFSNDPSAMTVATVSPDGQPSQRMVLLKHVDDKGFVFYTNLESRKARELKGNPKVSLHFPWHPIERQVIVYGEATQMSVAETTRYFLSRPKDSQLAAWASHQSQRIGSRQLLEQAFEQMKNKFKVGEVPLPSFWGGFRVVPNHIEFWQGRRNRLHDRFMYSRRGAKQWEIERLQP
ncbi:pyridoxamine 5'-phosphate oxidase [Salinispirillum marinum]|uniref:Pyridoxine/pyridoxamine 5'-phosphate oxidase n=2 Tax=Saccharospirillaceae TaxID=255527 RepID=A0ABV8B998_9GAMM